MAIVSERVNEGERGERRGEERVKEEFKRQKIRDKLEEGDEVEHRRWEGENKGKMKKTAENDRMVTR